MIHELKHYEAHPGKGRALKARFEQATMPAFQRAGITLLQAWDVEGEPDSFCYLVSFASPAASEQAWKAFAADPPAPPTSVPVRTWPRQPPQNIPINRI